jgi:phosphoribosylformylglycinamidine synthase I
MRVRAIILRGPGTNCDQETEFALQRAGAQAERVHLQRLLDGDCQLTDYDLIALPGGFTYADDIGAGRIMALLLRERLGEQLEQALTAQKIILGICNGFQILLQIGALGLARGEASLTFNDSGRFQCDWTETRLEKSCISPALRDLPELAAVPIAHGEGKFVATDQALSRLEAQGQIAFRYQRNPNGSLRDIAGVCDPSGRILGLMPHPERAICARRDPASERASLRFLENLVTLSGA